jgi:carbon-monoxide dehydrogenase medium subunit
MPACALALGATFLVESVDGQREIPSAAYFKGLYETERRPNELLVETLIPVRRPQVHCVFMELARRHGDFAIAGVAFNLLIDDGVVHNSRLVYFGSEAKPTLGRAVAAAIKDKELDDRVIDAAVSALDADLAPMSNAQGSAKMRLHLQRVLTRRALAEARKRAAGRAPGGVKAA